MTLSGISSLYSNSTDSTSSIASLLRIAQNGTDGATSATTSTDSTTSASAATDISGPGAMMKKLQQLKESDPDKFKQVMSDMADQLSALAKQQGDTDGTSRLSQLASKFATAGQTGDLSALQPPPPPPPPTDAGQSAALSAYGASSG